MAAQRERKAKLDAGRVDTVFHSSTPSRYPAYTLALPQRMLCSPTVNVDRLKPFYARVGAPPAPGPVMDPGHEGETEVEQLLNRKSVRGVRRYLVRWRGHTRHTDTSEADEWVRDEDLGHCLAKVAEYEAAAPRRRVDRGSSGTGHQAPALPPPARALPVPSGQAGFELLVASLDEVVTGARLQGREVYIPLARGWLAAGARCPGD